MRFMDKVKKWFFEEDEDGEEFEEETETQDEEVEETPEVETEEPKTNIFERAKANRTSEVVNKLNANKDNELVLFEPRSYSETQDIATYLKHDKAAVVNLHRLQKEQSKRVIDFLSGVIYAIDGDIQQIGPKIFLCTPSGIGVTGNISLDDEEN
jgi:cell division inhibitor SepF